jgi:26S proteasome regulatory subunit N13
MQAQEFEKPFTTLPDLLIASSTLPIVETADDSTIDHLLDFLPPQLRLLALEIDDISEIDANSDEAKMVFQTLDLEQKKEILRRVLHSPQFQQSLASLTVALRDGGLPSISEALKIKVENGGFMRRGGVPLGGGDAVEAFLNGVKKGVEEEKAGDEMDAQ